MKKKVLVGMSGGVDSSVAAFLLKEQGYDVTGITMRMWRESDCLCGEDGSLCENTEAEDAARVAKTLGIPFFVMDFSQKFKSHVIDYFVEEYLQGRTPNPCIVCNRYVKWEALLAHCLSSGAEYIATGHYARIASLPNGRLAICRSMTASKDQSYALYSLTQEQLAHTLMPIGNYEKKEIRMIAEQAGLPVADKPDSQEICFVPDNDYAGFIDRMAGKRVPEGGNFVDAHGQVLGKHKGITHYTIGQRRGLELPMGERVYVTGICSDKNEVVIGQNEELFTKKVLCHKVNFMSIEDLTHPMRVFGKIRYNHKGAYCTIEKMQDGSVYAEFEEPVRAAAPGQSICFYEGDYVLGGGIIV